MGRPTDNPKVNNYRIRMTDEELRKLEKCCEYTGLSKADVIRLGIQKVYDEVNENQTRLQNEVLIIKQDFKMKS